MPQGQEANPTTPQSTFVPPPSQSPTANLNGPIASQIKQSLGGKSPFAAIKEMQEKQNAENLNFKQPIEPAAPIAPSRIIENPVEVKPETHTEPDAFDIPIVPPKVEDTPPDEPPVPDDGLEVPDVPIAENFKKLRAKVRAEVQAKKELEEKSLQLETELNDYKTGKVAPDILVAQETRISELERYEKLHNLKMSKEYTEKFIKPLNSIKTKINEIAKDYGVPEDIMEHALTLTNRAELNGFLSEHFDEIGGAEVKSAINNIQSLQDEAKLAEGEPAKALMHLQQEHKEIQTIKDHQRKSTIAAVSKDAWGRSLDRIREEGKAKELIFKPNDSSHNENFVLPVLKAASQEFGKLVRALAENGLEILDDNLADALSRTVLLAHASAVSIESREAALKHAAEVEEASRRVTKYNRPAIGSGVNNGSSSPSTPQRTTPQQASSMLVNKVLAGRGK